MNNANTTPTGWNRQQVYAAGWAGRRRESTLLRKTEERPSGHRTHPMFRRFISVALDLEYGRPLRSSFGKDPWCL